MHIVTAAINIDTGMRTNRAVDSFGVAQFRRRVFGLERTREIDTTLAGRLLSGLGDKKPELDDWL
jgi:hypothetical protein